MNILKTFNRILAGPVFVPQNYGDYLWIAAFVALHINPHLNIVYLGLGFTALYPILMYYNLSTVTLVRNAVIEEASPELLNEISEIAKTENAMVSSVQEVSNFTLPTLICGRFASNAEFFIGGWSR